MTAMGIPANAKQLATLVKEGEGPALEFKRSTGGRHDSKLVNPLIAGSFHRAGAVEVWERGTNRVITMCRKHGAAPPIFKERQGFLVVTFKTRLVAEDTAERPRAQSTTQLPTQSATQSTDPVDRIHAANRTRAIENHTRVNNCTVRETRNKPDKGDTR